MRSSVLLEFGVAAVAEVVGRGEDEGPAAVATAAVAIGDAGRTEIDPGSEPAKLEKR
jgi:hypothetical protein